MENEILEVEKQRQEIIKRIQEKERLINLIKSRHVKGDMNEIKEFQKKYNETKLEKPSELIKQESNKDLNEIIPNENNINNENNNIDKKTLASLKFNSFQYGINYITKVKQVQRAYRKYILNKKKNLLRHYYLNKLINEFYKPISIERGAELRKIMIQKLKQLQFPEKDMKDVINQYYKEYKDFCFNFPEHENLREDNFFIYYQCMDLLNYMENLKPETALEKGEQFNQFMLDKNKEFSTKLLIDQMEKQYRYKNDIYEDTFIDEFEENNLLDEIDNRYNFEPRKNILNKKP
jgi:hypothetical protein